MTAENIDIWIKTGYETLAYSGLKGLKVETLAKKVGISKSSFYHHFADLEVFINFLLNYHLEQSYVLAEKEKKCKTINPELIDTLIEHKTDLLFNRFLRINRENRTYNETLTKSNQIVGNYFVLIWVNDLKLNLSPNQLQGLFELALENFYLKITPELLNKKWLTEYFDNLKKVIENFGSAVINS